jgi:hypothetical protein
LVVVPLRGLVVAGLLAIVGDDDFALVDFALAAT